MHQDGRPQYKYVGSVCKPATGVTISVHYVLPADWLKNTATLLERKTGCCSLSATSGGTSGFLQQDHGVQSDQRPFSGYPPYSLPKGIQWCCSLQEAHCRCLWHPALLTLLPVNSTGVNGSSVKHSSQSNVTDQCNETHLSFAAPTRQSNTPGSGDGGGGPTLRVACSSQTIPRGRTTEVIFGEVTETHFEASN